MLQDRCIGQSDGLFLEKLGEGRFGMLRNYQTFLFRPPFTLTCFFILFRHSVLVSQSVPRPGVGPGWSYPRECKSRLSTSSSTGAKSVLDAGAVMPLKESAAPAFSEPSSAALSHSSSRSSATANSNHSGEQIGCNGLRLAQTRICQSVSFASACSSDDYIAIATNFFENAVNSPEGQSTSGLESFNDFAASSEVIASKNLLTENNQENGVLGRKFHGGHKVVRHKWRQYVRPGTDIHSNTIEGVFSLIRRGVMGTFHSVSRKHLANYLNEFQFRWNTRKLDDGERVSRVIKAVAGKRLEYRQSVENPPYVPAGE